MRCLPSLFLTSFIMSLLWTSAGILNCTRINEGYLNNGYLVWLLSGSDGCFKYLKGDIKKAQTAGRTKGVVWIPIYYPKNVIECYIRNNLEALAQISKLPKVSPQPGTLISNFFIQSLCLGREALARIITI